MTVEDTIKVLSDHALKVEIHKRNKLRISPKCGKLISTPDGSIHIYFPSGTCLKLANSYRDWQIAQVHILTQEKS